MSELNKELGFLQGVGLLSTSLLGTGIFAVPAIIAGIAGLSSLWAWPILLVLVFPIAIIFAELGKHYPSAGGVAYFITSAFNARLGRVTAWLFLSVIPVGLPAALVISTGFWQSLFQLSPTGELMIQITTLLLIWVLGRWGAGASGWIQSIIALLIIGLVLTICFATSPSVVMIDWMPLSDIHALPVLNALSVMFWCFVGLEAFVHLTTEFKHPERDFPRALIMGLLVAGFVYWACTAAVLFFAPDVTKPAMALPAIVSLLFGQKALWIFCLIGYLACFASVNIYSQSFARLIWAQASEDYPTSRLAKLSVRQTPFFALSVVIACSLVSLFATHFFSISLHNLLEYANGVFVLIYLLAMIAAIKLLNGKMKILAGISTIICIGLLFVIGYKSLYAVAIFIGLWLIAKKKSS